MKKKFLKHIPSKKQIAQQGFTLIELLVVVSIIALLSSVVLGSVSVARRRGIDAAIIQDVKQLQNAAELYYTANRAYPAGEYQSTWTSNGGVRVDESGVAALLSPFLKSMPRVRHLENGNLLLFIGAGPNPVYRCNTSDFTAAGAPKYMILFSSYYPLKYPTASESDGVVTNYDGLNGSPRYYCVSAQ